MDRLLYITVQDALTNRLKFRPASGPQKGAIKMAHEITLLDQIVTQMGTARAWHGLDKQKDLNGMTAPQGAIESGLGHEVRLVPLTRIDNNVQTGLYGIYSDKNPDPGPFQVVSEKFNPVQPGEFYEWAYSVCGKIGGSLSSAGTLKG